jgi:hypothetical protein
MFQGLYCSTNGKTPPYQGNFFPSIGLINSQSNPPGYFTGLNIYYPAWMMYDLRKSNTGKNTDELPPRHEFHNNDEAFWNSSKNFMFYPNKTNPSNPVQANQGLGFYLSPPRTVITKTPFVCWFNDGEGDFYNIDGVNASTGAWNNLADQSILPSFRYEISGINDIRTNATGLVYSPASNLFTGGSALSVDMGNSLSVTVSLFQCEFNLALTTYFTIIAKETGTNSYTLTLSHPDFADAELFPQAPQSLGNGWYQYKFLVMAENFGMPVSKISLTIGRPNSSPATFILGQFAILDSQYVPIVPPQNIPFNAPIDVLDWSKDYRPTSHYRVFGINANGTFLIGVAYNSTYRVAYKGKACPNTFNAEQQGFTKYIVQEVNEAGQSRSITEE